MASGKAAGLLELGLLLADAGHPVTDIQNVIHDAASADDRPDITASVSGNAITVDDPLDEGARLAVAPGRVLSYGQISAASLLAAGASQGAIPLEALPDKVQQALDRGHSTPRWAIAVGCAIITLGMGFAFSSPLWAIPFGAILGLVSSIGLGAVPISTRAKALVPLGISFVTTLALSVVARCVNAHMFPLTTVALPVVVLVPGALITQAVLEISGGDAISGGGRLVTGLLTWALMAGGIILGLTAVGAVTSGRFVVMPWGSPVGDQELGIWASGPPAWTGWIGMILLGLGFALMVWCPLRPTLVLMAILLTCYVILHFGSQVMGTTVSTGIAAAVGLFLARTIERKWPAIPSVIMFRPTFWSLVPGTAGLVGILASTNSPIAAQGSAAPIALTIVAIAVGLQLGALASELTHRQGDRP